MTLPVASIVSPIANVALSVRAEQIDAAGRILDVVPMPLPPRKSIEVTAPWTRDDLIQAIRDEVGAGRAVGVDHLVDPRLARCVSSAGAGRRGRAEIDAAARRDVVAAVERPQEVVLLNDADRGERRRAA